MRVDMQNSNKKIIFSVIMPCYNSEEYVKNAIDSIVNQTYPYWELIAINDGSIDATLSILQSYAETDERKKIYSKSNGGYVSAVNLGLEKITGDYFLLLGSEDKLSEELFYTLNENAKEKLPDCIAFRTKNVCNGVLQQDIEKSTRFYDKAEMYDTNISEYIETYSQHAAIFSVRDTSKCYRSTLLDDLRYFGKFGIDADGIFSMLICHKATSFCSVPFDGYFWTLRKDSVSAQVLSDEKKIDKIANWIQFYDCLSTMETDVITSAEKGYIGYFYNTIKYTWREKNKPFKNYKIVKCGLKAIKKFEKKHNYKFLPKGESRLLLYMPLVWKIKLYIKAIVKSIFR